MSRYMSKRFDSLCEYVPGEQPLDKKYIKLNTNESPYPPSYSVIEAVSEEADLTRLYPDPTCSALRNDFAKLYGVDAKNVIFGNGSDEILNFCFMAYCDDKKGMAFPNISYGFYSVFAELYSIDYSEVPLNDDFTIDVESYCNLDKNIVIANPNAPTGIALDLCDIEKILQTNKDNVVIIDEAYVDFGGESAVGLIGKYDNLIVVGTFSKSRSLAGARLGFAFANESLIKDIDKLRFSTNPYNINRLTLSAGVAAVKDNDYYVENAKEIIKTREYITNELKNIGFEVLNSKANFVFAKCLKNIGGEKLYLMLKDRGILVRHFNKPVISDYLRITIGLPEEMEALIKEIKDIVDNL